MRISPLEVQKICVEGTMMICGSSPPAVKALTGWLVGNADETRYVHSE